MAGARQVLGVFQRVEQREGELEIVGPLADQAPELVDPLGRAFVSSSSLASMPGSMLLSPSARCSSFICCAVRTRETIPR